MFRAAVLALFLTGATAIAGGTPLTTTLVTGGLSAVGHPVDDVYAATWQIMIGKSEDYYRRFPGDRARVRDELPHDLGAVG